MQSVKSLLDAAGVNAGKSNRQIKREWKAAERAKNAPVSRPTPPPATNRGNFVTVASVLAELDATLGNPAERLCVCGFAKSLHPIRGSRCPGYYPMGI